VKFPLQALNFFSRIVMGAVPSLQIKTYVEGASLQKPTLQKCNLGVMLLFLTQN
jgi:hypothetical protein